MSNRSLIALGEEMLKNGGNAAQALTALFPDKTRTSKQTYALSHRIRQHPIVAEMLLRGGDTTVSAITAALDRYGLSADIAADQMARAAYTEMRQVCDVTTIIDPDTGEPKQVVKYKDFNDIDPDAHKAKSEIIQNPDGSVRYKLVDKLAAQMHLARLKGWIQDKPEPVVAAVQLIIQR